MLDDALKAQLQQYLGMLRQPIRLIASLDDSETGKDMGELLNTIVGLSDKVTLDTSGTDARKPSFAVVRDGETQGVRFAGLPLGHEFTSLVLALLWTGGHPPKVEQDVIDSIKGLDGDFNFEVYMSLSCHNCPDVVQALSLMAIVNPKVKTVVIEGGAFQKEVEERQIMAVPMVFLNGQVFGSGRMSVEEIVAKLDTNGPKLAADLEAQVHHYGVDIMAMQRASKIVSAEQTGGMTEVHLENGGVLKAKSVILSTGARWRNVNVPGEAEYKNKGVAYCPHCDGPLFKGKRVSVIGGGNSGVEAAIDLAGLVEHVTLIEFADQLKADAVLVNKLKSLPNVTIHANAQTTEITGEGGKVNGLSYKDRATDVVHHIELEGVFVQIGLVPNTEFLKGSLELSKFGEIVIDAKGHTSMPGVFAAGDCTTVPYKQIIIAAGEGAKAALSAFDHLIRN